jgi:hypothetical protein
LDYNAFQQIINLTIQVRKKLEQIININNTNEKEIFFHLSVPSKTFKERHSPKFKAAFSFFLPNFTKFQPEKI